VLALIASASALTPGHAHAEEGGPVTDSKGAVWMPHSYAAFLALPQVLDFDRVIASVSKGSFQGSTVEEMEGSYYRVAITQQGRVTRSAASGFGTDPTVTYVAGSRACSRKAAARKQLMLARDAVSDFKCRAAGRRDLRGREWATTLTPTDFATDGGVELVYLVRQESAPPEDGVLAQMAVIAMEPKLLAAYGLVGFVPQRRLSLAVRPDRVESDLSQGNGYGWSYQWRTLDSAQVPSLPAIMSR
jgi:hypothetical protein